MKCRINAKNGGYEIITPYRARFVSDLKAYVPAGERSYNAQNYRWTVSAQYGDVVQKLISDNFGEWVDLPKIVSASLLGVVCLLYLGEAKIRGNGTKTAYGWTQPEGALAGGWNVVFPEKVLKNYFDPSSEDKTHEQQKEAKTFYETLGLKFGADPDDIRSGYRRMVKQWHPDVCKDPDAHEIFIGIQKAYETLSNPIAKIRYDVGLKIAATTKPQLKPKQDQFDFVNYRAPLKCGNLLCEYTMLGMLMKVSKILNWEDIYDNDGKVLISSWKAGDTEPTLIWR